MNSQTQTIELLKLLGDETAEAVLAHLDPAQAGSLRAGMSEDRSEEFDHEDHRDLLIQFGRFMDFAVLAGALEGSLNGPALFAPALADGTTPVPDASQTTATGQSGSGRLAAGRTRPGQTIPGQVAAGQTPVPGQSMPGQSVAAPTGSGPVAPGQPGATAETYSYDPSSVAAEFTEDGSPVNPDGGAGSPDIALKLTGNPVEDLATLSVYQIAGALDTEQPRTVAILLSELSYQLSADVLSLLRTEQQAAVVVELTRELEAPPVLVERIARATFQRGLTLPATEPDRRDRLDRLSDVLRAVPKKLRHNMMTGIEQEDQEMSQALLKKLYRFEDLVSLDSRVIQQVLGEVDGTTLTTALFQATPEIMDAILSNLSRRARQSIEEELAFQSHVPETRVLAARDSVAEVIARLDQESE